MRKHTKEFKSSISTFGRELDSKITVLGTELTLEKEDLFSITPITNSTLLKTVMKEVDFESKKQIGIGQEINVKSGVKVNGEYEYIDYGNYSVYKSEYKAETDTYSHICYDKMLKTMIDYTPLDITYPINLREYITAIATKCGLEFADKNSAFANYNTSINEDHFSNGNYTFRDVLDYVAELVGGWFCINDDDKLEIRYPSQAKNYESDSGEEINFYTEVEDKIKELTIYGNSIQETTTGKNLAEIIDVTKTIGSGLNYTAQNGEIKLNGTLSSNFGTSIGTLHLETNTDYYLSINNSASLNNSYLIINDNGTYIYFGVDRTFQVSQTKDYSLDMVVIKGTYNNLILKPQVELGTAKTSWERYTGGQPSPSPDYPSEIESVKGKNLFDGTGWRTVQSGGGFPKPATGATIVSSDANNISFTSEQSTYAGVESGFINVKANETYMFSAKFTTPTNRFFITQYDENKTRISTLNYTNVTTLQNTSFTTTNDGYITIAFTNATTAQTTYKIENIQLEKGSTATDYLPYDTIQVKSVGKNLIPNNWELADANYTKEYGKLIVSGNLSTSYLYGGSTNFIDLTLKSGTYTFSASSNTFSNIYAVVNNNGIIENWNNGVTKTFTSDVVVQSIRCNEVTLSTGTYLWIAQIEQGTQATTYEPYKENTLNINLQGNELCSLPNNVKDELVIENGRAKIIKNVGKVVLNGDDTITYNMSISSITNLKAFWFLKQAYPGLNIKTNSYDKLSNYFVYKKEEWKTVTSPCLCENSGLTPSMFIFSGFSDITSVNEFKNWLSTHNTTVYYELATPIEIDLGEVETLSTFKGVNNVSLDANMQTNMTITYPTEYEELDKHFLKDVNVSFSKKYGAVNSVVFSRGNGSDNIYRKDNASINKNGLTEIKIADNPFLEGDDRENFIQSLFDKINGLEFYIMDVASTGIMYLELGDFYYFNMVEEKPSLKSGLVKSGMRKAQGSSGGKFLCLLMNDEIKITQGLEESIYSDEPEITETDYKTASITDTSIKNAIIQTNKNSAEILLKVNSDEVVSAINLSPEKIKISSAKLDIDAIATFTNSKLAEAGSTVINGANITTGSINCDRLNGGTINGQKISGSTISGGSISIQKGVYYFNMGTSTSNPNCSGLNVGTYGIKAHSDITATGFAITDSDTGKSESFGIKDYHGHVHYLTFTGGILTKWEYK